MAIRPIALLAVAAVVAGAWNNVPPEPLRFRTQEIQREWGVVYAVRLVDVDADGRLDILAINPSQMAWFENPDWRRHVIVDDQTPRDNVCIAATDLDGDGRPEVALGASWNPRDTEGGGTLHLARRSTADGRAPWTLAPLGNEPTLHRINFADPDGTGVPALIVAPLHGRGTAPPDWRGPGARIFALHPPTPFGAGDWRSEEVDVTRHILHNFLAANLDGRPGDELVTASREGLTRFTRVAPGQWQGELVGRGAPGEVALGRVDGRRMLASVEPWHGTTIVIHRDSGEAPWRRTVIEEHIRGGHALGWADFDGDGTDELAAGWRDGDVGLAVYGIDGQGARAWRHMVDAGGVAVEDLAIGDLNGDGRPDLVAGGRRTENIRIYWNEPPQ